MYTPSWNTPQRPLFNLTTHCASFAIVAGCNHTVAGLSLVMNDNKVGLRSWCYIN